MMIVNIRLDKGVKFFFFLINRKNEKNQFLCKSLIDMLIICVRLV